MPKPKVHKEADFPGYPSPDETPFETIMWLGTSAHATISKVIDKRTKEIFARKEFTVKPSTHASWTDEDETRCLEVDFNVRKELHTMMKLDHPHIVEAMSAYTVGTDQICLIMRPAASHGDLATFMANYRNAHLRSDISWEADVLSHDLSDIDEIVLLYAFSCLAKAVDYIHSRGMRHRDIKPQNCLVHHGNVLLADFGMSEFYRRGNVESSESLGSSGLALDGSYRYAAPELIADESRNDKTDIFSLGCVFVELVATLLGDRCWVDPWHPLGNDSWGNPLMNIEVRRHPPDGPKWIGSYHLGIRPIVQALGEESVLLLLGDNMKWLLQTAIPNILAQEKEGRISAADLLESITERHLSWDEFWATQETNTTRSSEGISYISQHPPEEWDGLESRLQAGSPYHTETRPLYEETWDQHQQGMEPLNAEFQAISTAVKRIENMKVMKIEMMQRMMSDWLESWEPEKVSESTTAAGGGLLETPR